MSKQDHVQCYEAHAPLENVKRCMREGHHVMVLMRGVPGSGKSHLAKDLVKNHGGVVYSTDDYFVRDGRYQFQSDKLEEYHRSNILRVREAMKDGIKPIIVDNTNIYVNHMEQYTLHAVNHCYEIFVVEPDTWWRYKAYECFKRNTHGLEKEKISFMLQSLEEQGKPTLARLVGRTRQVRLEPPCVDFVDDIVEKPNAEFVRLGLQKPNGTCVFSLAAIADDLPPGLPVALSTAAVDSPSRPMLSPASKEVPISLAVDPRSHITSVTVRDMSTHTNEVVVTLTCAGIECEVNDVEEGPSKTVEKIKYEQPQMKDRVCKMEYVPQVSELDVLLAIFPYEDIINISHYYQMLGLEECVRLFVELGAYVEWNATVVEGAFNEEIAAAEVSATCPHGPPPITNWQRVAEEENMKDRPLSPTPVAMNSNDSMVNEVTVTLGLDILQKMNVIFGNGGPVEQECSLNVPLWILEQLYHVWRKDSTQSQRDEDAQLAAFLQEDQNLDNAGDIYFRKTGMPISRKLQLKMLIEEFSMCDEQSVQRIFQDNNCDASATRNTLHLMLNPDLDTIEPFTPVANKGTATVSPSVRSRKPVTNLSQAQEEALQYQMEADLFAEKRKEQVQKMQRYIRSGLPSAVGAYQLEAREHALREKNLRQKAANVIIEAHQHSPFLDLHLLSQKDAIALLKSRLAVLDRPENARNGRSDRRLRVITGYGKSSGGRSVIKPAVESYLKNKGYHYSFTNMGEVTIQCK